MSLDDSFAAERPSSQPPLRSVQTQMTQLRSELHRHNHLYYNVAKPEITNREFDTLLEELKTLEAQYPQFDHPRSPTKQVGGAPLAEFTTIRHRQPMLSIEDIHELKPEELDTSHRPTHNLIAWYTRLERLLNGAPFTLSVEPKIDGVAITLYYLDGKLQYAATRGDGTFGDDVTQNVLTIPNIPLRLDDCPKHFEVRGEILMRHDAFSKLNEDQIAKGETPFKNPRNATAGSLKQLDPKVVATRPLDCVFHSFGQIEPIPFETIESFQTTLEQYTLQKSSWFRVTHTIEKLLEAVEELNLERHNLPYETDGAVIKVNELIHHNQIGFTSKFPKWACAFKYLPQQAETTLESITIQVGRTGVLTPVANLTPVDVSGSTVARATLHNEEEIHRKDIRIGDRVLMEKAGEIIPSIVKVLLELRPTGTSPFDLYEHVGGKCPSCGGEIQKEEGFVAWRCHNFQCPAQAMIRIQHFTQRKALDIDGIGESVAAKLVENRLAQSPLDLFTLDLTQLSQLLLEPKQTLHGKTVKKERRFGEKRAIKTLDSIAEARQSTSLAKWIYGMGIPLIGESSAKELSRLHKSFEDIAASPILSQISQLVELEVIRKELSPHSQNCPPDEERDKEDRKLKYDKIKAELAALQASLEPYGLKSDLGPSSASSIQRYFQSSTGQNLLDTLKALQITPKSDNYAPLTQKEGIFHGKVFVITGTLSQPRNTLRSKIETLGGTVSGSLSKRTDFLILGEKAGSKREKAIALQIPILNENEFQALVEASHPLN